MISHIKVNSRVKSVKIRNFGLCFMPFSTGLIKVIGHCRAMVCWQLTDHIFNAVAEMKSFLDYEKVNVKSAAI